MLKALLPQGPADLTQQQLDNGEGKGWMVDSLSNVTPDGYDEVFEELNIPKGSANRQRDVTQMYPFRNCRHRHNVRSRLPLTCFFISFSFFSLQGLSSVRLSS